MTTPAQRFDAQQRRSRMRGLLVRMIITVVALDALAIGGYRVWRVDLAAARTRMLFTILWTVVSAVVVAVWLRRIRALRTEGR